MPCKGHAAEQLSAMSRLTRWWFEVPSEMMHCKTTDRCHVSLWQLSNCRCYEACSGEASMLWRKLKLTIAVTVSVNVCCSF